MENELYICTLFDYYKDLLTDKQKNFFIDYHFDNLTLQEISENNEISRNAVHKQLKDTEIKLLDYETKLKLYEKSKKIEQIIENIDNEIKEQIRELI